MTQSGASNFDAVQDAEKKDISESRQKGTIRYSQRYGQGTPDGKLLYLKASLTGHEPADVLEYHSNHSGFPHQSTADQWFDESQFKSYRLLGQYVAEKALEPDGLEAHCLCEEFFRELFSRLFSVPPGGEGGPDIGVTV